MGVGLGHKLGWQWRRPRGRELELGKRQLESGIGAGRRRDAGNDVAATFPGPGVTYRRALGVGVESPPVKRIAASPTHTHTHTHRDRLRWL